MVEQVQWIFKVGETVVDSALLRKIPFFRSFLFITSFCNIEHLFSFFDGESLNHLVDFSWSWFLDRIVYISELVVVSWNKCSVVISLSRGAIIKILIIEVFIVLWSMIWAFSSNTWFLAFEAKSFLEEIISFFEGQCIDFSSDGINVHSVWVILGSGLIIVSSLISWSRGISSSIDLSESRDCWLSSHRSIISFSEC